MLTRTTFSLLHELLATAILQWHVVFENMLNKICASLSVCLPACLPACLPLCVCPTPGLFFTLLDLLRLRKLALSLEDLWGGRVGVLSPPNPQATDPFVLLAHHRHTFWPLDPVRVAQKFIVPEGFPAHPHRGFQTVTYVMKVSGCWCWCWCWCWRWCWCWCW